MAKKITDMVSWVGKVDWELTHFHGDELSTKNGSMPISFRMRRRCLSIQCGSLTTTNSLLI